MDNNPQMPPMPADPQVPPMPAEVAPAQAPTQTPPIAPQQSPTNPNIISSEEKKSSSKLIIFLIVGILVIAVLVGAIYWYLSSNQSVISNKSSTGNTPVPVVQQPVSTESLERDLNAVNVATDDSDLTSVEQDLQGL